MSSRSWGALKVLELVAYALWSAIPWAYLLATSRRSELYEYGPIDRPWVAILVGALGAVGIGVIRVRMGPTCLRFVFLALCLYSTGLYALMLLFIRFVHAL